MMAEDMAKQNQNKVSISYYNWEGDACRVHEDAKGNLTADIYRAGKGTLPVSPTDVMFNSREIGEDEYKELVLEEIAISKKRKKD
jgi:L-rhamnose isomerase